MVPLSFNSQAVRDEERGMKRNKKDIFSKILYFIVMAVFLTIIAVNYLYFMSITQGSIGNLQENIQSFLQYMPTQSNMTDVEKVESTLLGTGLTIISIAIAIWAGLNIANSIERKELNRVSEKIEMLDKKSKKTLKTLRQSNIIYKNFFIQELMNLNEDETSKFFAKKFQEEELEKKLLNEIDRENIYIHLTNIEQLFYQVYHLHEVQSVDKQNIIKKAELGKDAVKRLRNVLNKYSLEDSVIILYLDYRNIVFDFYMGYCVDSIKRYDCFLNAADGFKQCSAGFGVNLPQMDNENYLCFPQYDFSKENTMRMAIFLSNSIGEAYSKISEQYHNLVGKSSEHSFKITHDKLLTCAKQAIFYCGCACEWEENDIIKREVYFRNLGCAYERYDKILNPEGTALKSFTHEILENYYKAFLIAVGNQKVTMNRMEKVYYVNLSYLNRYIMNRIFKQQLGIEKKFENIDRQNDVKNQEISNLDLNLLMRYRIISDMAVSDMARYHVYYCFNGFAYTYIIFLILAGNMQIISNYGRDVSSYMTQVKNNIDRLHIILTRKDDYKDILEARYEKLQDYILNYTS